MKNYERTFFGLCLIIVGINLIMTGIIYYINCNKDTYTTNAIVIEVNDDEVIIETEDGNVWTFEDTEWKVNDALTVKFYDNQTEEVTDDEIVDYKITGHLN